MESNTNQTEHRDSAGKFIKGNKPKAGFDKYPENRNDGGWKKEDSYSYQLNLMDRMTVTEFNSWRINNPEDKRTMAQEKAYNAQVQSKKELAWLKEVTDRTEGKAIEKIETHTTANTTVVLHDQARNEDAFNKQDK
jgi:hypothetical protein